MLVIGTITSCEKSNLPPNAVLNVYPSQGDTTLVYEFTAGESTDDRNFALALSYRWDFDGDGVWDTEFLKYSSIAYQFIQPGNYRSAVEVKDLDGLTVIARDSVVVFGENLETDTLFDSRDGHTYRTVKIGGLWWMSENLRYGQIIQSDKEQTDNDTIEMYLYSQCLDFDTVGGIYSWLESKNYHVNDNKGICPDGWHLPTRLDWEQLLTPFPKLYALQYYGKQGLSNLNLDLNNGGIRRNGLFGDRCFGTAAESGFWSSSYTMRDQEYKPYYCSFSSEDHELYYGYWADGGLSRYYSVRCVKNYK